MTRCSNAIRTFSVGFPEPDSDESTYAQWVSSRFRTEHRTVSVTAEEFGRWLPDGLAAMDQPTFDGLNTYCVARTARASGLTVALSGLGGDELFGGYPHFRQVQAIARGARFGTWLPDLPRRLVTRSVGGLHGWRKVVQVIGSPVPGYYAILGAYQVAQALFPASFQRRLLQRYEEVEGVWFGLPLEFVAFFDNDG
jgi:asparagine synthase (glutamine-hydrolysing)